jgi:eukaryotic-like serine/threonine-protein kinase
MASARKYRIERYLTEGGMGAIYIGKKLGPGGFEKEVVLKQLLPEYTARPEFRDLFFREAKISATLDHANIVHTFDLVESDESLFIVMEYVRGVDLRTIVRRAKLRRRELAPAAALHVTLEVLAGLAYAHNRRSASGASLAIIHRDVSPSNILCSAQGEVKLSDFGIAKAATHSSMFYRVRGKVGYMSPEQARNEPIDHRTDLYSVAVCLYEALTAERLFVGDLSTPAEVLYGQPIVPPSQKRKLLPKALDAVLATALAPKPDDRYQDAVAFSDALRQVAHRHGLLFSAPQLAEHLRHILGRNQEQWLSDDKAGPSGDPSTQKIPARELEGKEAKSIGVVMDGEGANLFVVGGNDPVLSQGAAAVNSRNPKSDPRRPLSGSRFGLDDDDDVSDDTTTKVADPMAAAERAAAANDQIPIDEDEAHDRDGDFDVGLTPPPPLRPMVPPPPRRPTLPPPPPESPFDEFPPTPAPMTLATLPLAPPAPSPFGQGSFENEAPEFSSDTPPPMRPAMGAGGPVFAQQGPPPGRRGLPRPGGYLDPAYDANLNLHMPPAPPQPAVFDPGGGFGFPETVDFRSGSQPVVVRRRSGPPGLLVLIVMLAAAAGGAKLGEVVTRGAVQALDAATASAPQQRK